MATRAPRVVDPGRYEVICEHGRGGLGRVTRMHDRELGRDVAVKELLTHGPISERRFAREARITARLEHPGIVPVYEAGRWPDGTPFYAMKLVSGRPLRDLIAERKTVDERIALLHHVIAVADAMAYAHERDVIHRDLKPANVIVGEFGETVVIDWGLAKDLNDATTIGGAGSTHGSDDGLTTAGSVLGTPAYMAPEQERGEVVDQRADVFAIGAMLWELCSLHKVPPADRRQRRLLLRRAGIDDDLAEIIDKAIDRDRGRRYAHAGELAADLRAFKSGARISARSYSLAAILAHWTRRHRVLALGLAGFLAVLVVSVASLAWLYRQSNRNAGLAQRNAEVAQDRLVRSYVDQGRRALLDEAPSVALAFLTEAMRRGDHSRAVEFMLERAAAPFELELLRLPSIAPRTWQASFSRSSDRLLTSDDLGARMWNARTGALLFSMPSPDTVFFARFTPDERRVITVSRDGFVRIWHAQDGSLERVMGRVGPARRYVASALSPDGSIVATASDDVGAVELWSIASGELLATLPTAQVATDRTLAFDHDGRWLAAGSSDLVRVFDVKSGHDVTELETPGLRVLRFDPTGPRLVTGTERGDVSLWRIPDGARAQHLLQGGEAVCDLAVSPDGELVAAAFLRSSSSEVIWRARTGEVQARILAHEYGNVRLEFDSASKLLASGGPKGRIAVSDVMTGTPLLVLESSARAISSMAFDRDSRRLIGAALDGTTRVCNLGRSYRVAATREIGPECGTDVNQDIDRRFIALSCGKRPTLILDSETARVVAELPPVARAEGVWRVPFPSVASDGTRAAIARGDRVEVYQLPGARLIETIAHPGLITVARFAPNGHVLVTASRDGTVNVSDDGQTLLRRRISQQAIDVVAVLPAGRLLIADATPRLAVYRIRDGAELAAFALETQAQALRVSENGDRAIVLPVVHHLHDPALYDLEGAGLVAALEGHTSQVYSARFVRDERQILTSSTDGTARFWDGRTGQLRQTLTSADGMLVDAVLSPADDLVVGAGGDGSLRFWDVASGSLIWKLRAHGSFVSEVKFEHGRLISRGSKGDLAVWNIAMPAASADPLTLTRFERLVACGPWRFDEPTGTVVAQPLACAASQL
jgi:WD40 repeat protein